MFHLFINRSGWKSIFKVQSQTTSGTWRKKQHETADVDAFLISMTAYYTGKPITIISANGTWQTSPTMGDDIILIHKGGQGFIDTDHGNY